MQGQDYVFVREFVPFVSSVLLKSWKESEINSDMEIILGGLAALSDELSWFKNEASKWGVNPCGITPLAANTEYCRYFACMGNFLFFNFFNLMLYFVSFYNNFAKVEKVRSHKTLYQRYLAIPVLNEKLITGKNDHIQ